MNDSHTFAFGDPDVLHVKELEEFRVVNSIIHDNYIYYIAHNFNGKSRLRKYIRHVGTFGIETPQRSFRFIFKDKKYIYLVEELNNMIHRYDPIMRTWKIIDLNLGGRNIKQIIKFGKYFTILSDYTLDIISEDEQHYDILGLINYFMCMFVYEDKLYLFMITGNKVMVTRYDEKLSNNMMYFNVDKDYYINTETHEYYYVHDDKLYIYLCDHKFMYMYVVSLSSMKLISSIKTRDNMHNAISYADQLEWPVLIQAIIEKGDEYIQSFDCIYEIIKMILPMKIVDAYQDISIITMVD